MGAERGLPKTPTRTTTSLSPLRETTLRNPLKISARTTTLVNLSVAKYEETTNAGNLEFEIVTKGISKGKEKGKSNGKEKGKREVNLLAKTRFDTNRMPILVIRVCILG